MNNVSTLRPGLLVSLKTSVVGNVSYTRRDIKAEHITEEGTQLAAWETERTITDPQEHDKAIKVRSKCRSLITAVCSTSTFGLLCPEADSAKLDQAVREAQALAAQFNETAALSRIGVYVIAGRIAADDVEAVRAINSEVRDLMDQMKLGLERLDVKLVRDAANKAREIGQMLSPDAEARITVAINAVRTAARQIVKAAEQGEAEIDQVAIRRVTEARTAFLDLDEAPLQLEMSAPAQGRAVDLAPVLDPVDKAELLAGRTVKGRSLELADAGAPAFDAQRKTYRPAPQLAFE